MNLKWNFFLILPLLLASVTCLAAGPSFSIDVEDLVYIFNTSYAICILAPLLCLSGYIFHNRLLHILAWVSAILSIFASIVFTMDDLAKLSVIIPALCFFFILARLGKGRTGNRYLAVFMLSSALILEVFYASLRLAFEVFKPELTEKTFYPTILLIFFNMVLGGIIYKLQVVSNGKMVPLYRKMLPVFAGLIIGLLACLIEMNYTLIWPPNFRKLAMTNIHFTLSGMSYQNIFINAFCWGFTGLIVFVLTMFRHKGGSVKP